MHLVLAIDEDTMNASNGLDEREKPWCFINNPVEDVICSGLESSRGRLAESKLLFD